MPLQNRESIIQNREMTLKDREMSLKDRKMTLKERRDMFIEKLNISIANDVDDWVEPIFPTPVKRVSDIVNKQMKKITW